MLPGAGKVRYKGYRRPHRLVVRTAGFHPANWGSIPHGVTNQKIQAKYNRPGFFNVIFQAKSVP